MTNVQPTHQAALVTALAYHEAWVGGDLDRAMTHIAHDIVCDAPAGRLHGADALRAFMEPFAATVEAAQVLASYGDDEHAVLVYDTATALVPSAPGAEWHTVADGQIVAMRLIFDRLPFVEARRGSA